MSVKQSRDPQCTACGSPMKLSANEPNSTGHDLRTFTCPECRGVHRQIIESAATEAWLKPQRAIKARRENAVTYEIRDGRMISNPAK
jgi:hypothetical protein